MNLNDETMGVFVGDKHVFKGENAHSEKYFIDKIVSIMSDLKRTQIITHLALLYV